MYLNTCLSIISLIRFYVNLFCLVKHHIYIKKKYKKFFYLSFLIFLQYIVNNFSNINKLIHYMWITILCAIFFAFELDYFNCYYICKIFYKDFLNEIHKQKLG